MKLDEVDVLQVEPAETPEDSRGDWRCASCGSAYPVADGFKVLYDTVPGATAVAYVCPGCAAAARRTLGPSTRGPVR